MKAAIATLAAALPLLVAATASADEPPVVVNVSPFAPCVIKDQKGCLTGFEVELWEAIAKDAGITFTYQESDFESLLSNVRDGKVSVGFSGITMTADRESYLVFSHHTLDSGLQIVVPERHTTSGLPILSFFRMFGKSLSAPAVVDFAICLGLFYLVTAHVVWLLERNHGIRKRYFGGVFEALYFCIVTSSTVGYGDITPKRVAGRLCSIVLILTGVAWFSNFTALLAANYTAEKLEYSISCPADLRGKLVGTEAGTTSVSSLEKLGARVSASKTIDDAYVRLLRGELDAVVFDFPNVQNFVKTTGDGRVVTVGGVFDVQYYGFALPKGSPLLWKINRSLLKLRDDGTYDRIYHKWF